MAVVDLLDVDAQLLADGLGGPSQPTMQADHGGHVPATRELAALDHLGDHADPAEIAVLARQKEDAILVAGVDRQGRRDGGEDNRFVEWNQKKAHEKVQFL
jgi:hypothetical protein